VDAEVREPAEEYAPVIFAQNSYKHVISFDLLSGAVSTRSAPSPILPSQRFHLFHSERRPTMSVRKKKLQYLVFTMRSPFFFFFFEGNHFFS
jgi:hypothetical protein